MNQHIIVTGNPVDGFTHIGPFDTPIEAVEHAADTLEGDWWVAPMARVETEPVSADADDTEHMNIRASGPSETVPYVIRAKDSDGAEWDQLFTSNLPFKEATRILETAMRDVKRDAEDWNWGVVMELAEKQGVFGVQVIDTEEEL